MKTPETKKKRKDSAEALENFIIENKTGVVSKLKLMAKNHCMLTATFDNGFKTLNTSVIEVLNDMSLVALDYGADEALNTQLLASNRIFFKANMDGITIQFDAYSITKARLHDESVFAVQIPTSILWLQRREFFRVRIPLGIPAYCEIKQDDGSYRKYKVMDISAGGLSLHDEYQDLDFESGLILSACKLELPEHGHGQINLKINNTFYVNGNEHSQGRRIGCEFIGIGMSFSATIQRYINAIELARRKIEED